MQELVLQDHFTILVPVAKKGTWHVESKHLLQHHNNLIITANRFNYINNIIWFYSEIAFLFEVLGTIVFHIRSLCSFLYFHPICKDMNKPHPYTTGHIIFF